MDDSDYIHQRTDQILRDRIRYGMYGGEDGGGYGTAKGARTRKRNLRKKVCGSKSGKRTTRKRVTRKRRGGDEMMELPENELVMYYPATKGMMGGPRKPKPAGGVRAYRKRRGGEGLSQRTRLLGEFLGDGRKKKSSGRKKSSPWIAFVKHYARANNMSYGEALSEAGPAYRRKYGC